MFREQPEALATKVGEWSGVEKEVVYMFLGPSGLQQLNPAISPVHLEALTNSVNTLKQLGKLGANVNPENLTKFADDSYLKQAVQELGMNYDEMVNNVDHFSISGEDAETKQPIQDSKQAAQIWVKGEDKLRNFYSVKSMMTALAKLQKDGQDAASVIFVHDYNKGWKLFAENSFFVHKEDVISAFLTEKDAKEFANQAGLQVVPFKGLQQLYAQDVQPSALATNP
jgi:NitT/TauT family transport system substrate-binding protein